jgi:DNA polymerase-3 subunit epsilon
MAFDWQSAPIAFVDLETTGGRWGVSRILEVGIILLWPDGHVEHISELINPESVIPYGITELTGIRPEMVDNAPRFKDRAAFFYDKLKSALFVAHNARFDYGFLKHELMMAGYRLHVPVCCTVKLSRKIHPTWPRHNLDTLIARYQLRCEHRHRAWDDADLLRQLWGHLTIECGTDALRSHVDEIIKTPKIPSHLPVDCLDDLPQDSGVYYFYGENNVLLYIGKSKHIKQRVVEHFTKAERDSKEAKLVTSLRRIETKETVGEWGALLREAKLVKQLKPLYNKRLRANDQVGFQLKLRPDGGLTLDIQSVETLMLSQADGVYGSFKDVKTLKRALTELAKAHHLCLVCLGLEQTTSPGSCFAYQLKRCKGACVGEEPLIKHSLRVQMSVASLKMYLWPYPKPIAVMEKNWMDEREWHVFDRFCYLGSTTDPDELTSLSRHERMWDTDIYYLIKKMISGTTPVQVIECAP